MATLFDPNHDSVQETRYEADEYKNVLEDQTCQLASANADLTPLAVALGIEMTEVIECIMDPQTYAGWNEEAVTILDNAQTMAQQAVDEVLRAVQASASQYDH